ncbi:MAG: hypothetical protein H6710_04515 [Myxococcales bacterium]|nr:hypothetical protein [Myxococcales bacterium]MCB9705682.1 hypothetical protein [Myxococcales bacterium]
MRPVDRRSLAPLAGLAGLAVLTAPQVARADVAPPPTVILDALWLGPAGLVVLAGMIAVAVLIYRALRRRGRGRALAIAVALIVYVVADVAVYVAAISLGRRERPLPPEVG